MDLPIITYTNGVQERHPDAKCEMICESCNANHYAPLFDGWTCDCTFSIIKQKVRGKLVSRWLNNKIK